MRHFTAPKGWINDPNGLVYYEGEYHLFYQHNPNSNKWADMHWGHAKSRDLVHWEHLPIALYPENGFMMFSGSAIEDRENRTGLKENEHDPMILYFTAAGEPFEQRVAVSVDGGVTFAKRPGCVIPHIIGANRDPDIAYDAERNVYRLALYLDGEEYALYETDDLLTFREKQRILIPGDNECPNLYPVTADNGERMWILTGAHDVYFVGKFDADGIFTPVQPARNLSFGTKSYAAQIYNGTEGAPIRFSWNTTDMKDDQIQGSMCTPANMSLCFEDGVFKLCINPIPAFGSDPEWDVEADISDGEILRVPGGTIALRDGTLTVNGCACPAGNKEHIRTVGDTHALEVYVGAGDRFFCVPNEE